MPPITTPQPVVIPSQHISIPRTSLPNDFAVPPLPTAPQLSTKANNTQGNTFDQKNKTTKLSGEATQTEKKEDASEKQSSQPILQTSDTDPSTKEQYLLEVQKYHAFNTFLYDYNQDVFRWQFLSSKIIFFIVILLVLSGVYFSGVQFHISLRAGRVKEGMKKGEEANVDSTEKADVTALEASLKGIKVSSSILGVVILVISFLFFYLYLAYVFPIREIK
jgi:hypothetical protein